MKKKSVFGFIKGLLKRKDSHEKQSSLVSYTPIREGIQNTGTTAAEENYVVEVREQ